MGWVVDSSHLMYAIGKTQFIILIEETVVDSTELDVIGCEG